MGISLNGLTPAGTYPGLIKTGDNTAISGTPKVLSDGNGNNLPMEVSTTGVNLTGSPTVNSVAIANTTQVAAKQDTLVSGTNIKTINGTSLLGSGNIPVVTSPSGVSGAIQFSNGSAFASDATNLFWDDTNNRLGVGTNAPATSLDVNGSIRTGVNLTVVGEIQNPTVGVVNINGELRVASPNVSIGLTSYPARLAVRGSGSTSATTSLLVQNSAGSDLIRINDVGLFQLGGTTSAFPAIQRNLSEVRFRLADDSSFCNIRTRQHRFENASVLSDVADGVMIMANNAVNDFGRLCLGGTTASFPALKRSSTTLQSRLADDSGFAPLQGKLTTDSAYVASTQIATGYITIYDSTGTAYKVLVST